MNPFITSTGPGGAGTQGPQGAQGPSGLPGSQGAQGPQGDGGAQGAQGAQGTTGSQGAQGADGAQGAQGSQGTAGSQGSQGDTGAQGPQGYTGIAGAQGAQGDAGAQGAMGAQGPQGYTGIDGPQGAQGAQGAQGDAGVSYAADSWDYSWVAADGDPLTHGWSNAGTQNMTTASTTYLGVPCWSLAASGSSGTSYVKVASGVAAEGPFELRVKIAMPGSSGSSIRFPIGYNPNATEFGSRSLQLAITTAYLAFWNGANLATIQKIGTQIGIWITLTIRGYHSAGANGFAEWIFQPWVGGVELGIFDVSGGDATLGAAGDLFMGRLNVGTSAGTIYLAEIKMKNGINPAPPSYTLRNNTWPL